MQPTQDGLTCCDEARADGRSDFVTFLLGIRNDVDEALQRSRGDIATFRTLVKAAFDRFDSSAGAAAKPAAQSTLPPRDEGSSKKLKFSSARATLRVKTTVEVLLEEQRQAAAAAEVRGAASTIAAPKPKSRIMFSS